MLLKACVSVLIRYSVEWKKSTRNNKFTVRMCFAILNAALKPGSHLVHLPNVPRVQPALIINGLLGLLLLVQVAHEHMATIEKDLRKNRDSINFDW